MPREATTLSVGPLWTAFWTAEALPECDCLGQARVRVPGSTRIARVGSECRSPSLHPYSFANLYIVPRSSSSVYSCAQPSPSICPHGVPSPRARPQPRPNWRSSSTTTTPTSSSSILPHVLLPPRRLLCPLQPTRSLRASSSSLCLRRDASRGSR